MKKNFIYRLFTYYNNRFDLVKSQNGWYRFKNPIKKGKSLSMGVNFRYNKVRSFVDKESYSLLDYIMLLEDKTFTDAKNYINSFDITELDLSVKEFKRDVVSIDKVYPKEAKSFIDTDSFYAMRARKYLSKRGFNVEKLDIEGFLYCEEGEYADYIIIPVYHGESLVYFTSRNFMGGYLRYKNPAGIGSKNAIYNYNALYSYDEVFILEGWSDATLIGDNAIALFNWDLSDRQQELIIRSGIKCAHFVSDKGFIVESLLNAKKLLRYMDIKITHLENEIGSDVCEIGINRFNEIKLSHLFFKKNNFINLGFEIKKWKA